MTKHRLIALVLALAIPLASAGCFGSFQLVRKVYGFNAEVSEDRWIREGVFLLLNIPFVPVYSLASAVDALFLNSVEFWTGSNPLVAKTESAEGAHGEIAEARFNPDGTVDLTIIEADGTAHQVTVAREGGTLAARDTAGDIVARVMTNEAGQLVLLESARE